MLRHSSLPVYLAISPVFFALSGDWAAAQAVNACSIVTQNPVFTEERIESINDVSASFHKLECSANWSMHQDAINAGVDVGTEVYGVPLQVGGTFDHNAVDQWKSANCSEEDRQADVQTIVSRSYIQYDAINAQAALECVQAMFGGQALVCDIDQKSTAVVYSAYWRRTSGAKAEEAPKVTGFVTDNVNCLNADALEVGDFVPDGGLSIFCTPSDDAPIFVLNTDRGVCTAMGRAKAENVVLAGKMVLTGPYTQRGDAVTLADDLEIITGPYPVSVSADQLEIVGTPLIRSFEQNNASFGEPGENAGSVRIQARSVTGDGAVTILQAGQRGGDGHPGQQGPRGPTGGPGEGRTVVQKEVCDVLSLGGLNPFSKLVCNLVPTGCTGGKPGGIGGAGGIGQQGDPGMPGGHAGSVSLVVPVQAGSQFNILTNTDIFGSARDCEGKICGGLGGKGGPGGLGGKGGAGGQGAPGTTWCAGTIAGPDGPDGPAGPGGPDGPVGDNQFVRR